MRNYRLRLNFSNHLYKTQVKVILKHQQCLSELDHKFPLGRSRNTDWVSDWSAKLVENNFDI